MIDLSKLASSSSKIESVPISKLKKGDTFSFKPFTPGASFGDGTKIADDFKLSPVEVGSTFPVTIGDTKFKGVVKSVTEDGQMMIELT